MAKMVEIVCKCGCGMRKKVREADRKRGWGLYYSKSCKAKHQEKRTGPHRRYMERSNREHDIYGYDDEDGACVDMIHDDY